MVFGFMLRILASGRGRGGGREKSLDFRNSRALLESPRVLDGARRAKSKEAMSTDRSPRTVGKADASESAALALIVLMLRMVMALSCNRRAHNVNIERSIAAHPGSAGRKGLALSILASNHCQRKQKLNCL